MEWGCSVTKNRSREDPDPFDRSYRGQEITTLVAKRTAPFSVAFVEDHPKRMLRPLVSAGLSS